MSQSDKKEKKKSV